MDCMINIDKILPTDVFIIFLLSEGKGEKKVLKFQKSPRTECVASHPTSVR